MHSNHRYVAQQPDVRCIATRGKVHSNQSHGARQPKSGAQQPEGRCTATRGMVNSNERHGSQQPDVHALHNPTSHSPHYTTQHWSGLIPLPHATFVSGNLAGVPLVTGSIPLPQATFVSRTQLEFR